MLMQFVVENFLSCREKAVLSLLATEGVDPAEHHCVRIAGLPPILKCAAIYGANVSGKSNLLKALLFAQSLVVDGTKGGARIKAIPFKLDEESRKSGSRFEFEICCAGRRYSYGFVTTSEAIESEWLFVTEGTDEHLLFERNRVDAQPHRVAIELGDALAADRERKQFLRFVAAGTRPNQLFLTEADDRC